MRFALCSKRNQVRGAVVEHLFHYIGRGRSIAGVNGGSQFSVKVEDFTGNRGIRIKLTGKIGFTNQPVNRSALDHCKKTLGAVIPVLMS